VKGCLAELPGSFSVKLGNEYATGKLVQGAPMHARFWRIEVMNSGGAGIQVDCVLSNVIGVGIMLESLGMDGSTVLSANDRWASVRFLVM
jgi:hypothetical protein